MTAQATPLANVMTSATEGTREKWLEEAASLILDELIAPIANIRESLSLKMSVGYAPNTRADSKVIGVCCPSAMSGAGHNEIFISPAINDSVRVLDVLVHEIIHAVDDCASGHRGEFARIARAVGLEGKMQATYAGEKLAAYLESIVELIGHIPHAALDIGQKKKQTTRNLKVWCACGFKFNTSRGQIETVLSVAGRVACACCSSDMQFDV